MSDIISPNLTVQQKMS